MHAKKHHIWLFILGGLLSLLLAGCASNSGKDIKISDAQLGKYGNLSAADAIAVLEKRISEAKNNNMPFLSPNYFREASEILSDAKKSSAKKSKNELISDIVKADAILDKGQTMMAIVQSRLVNALALKNQLDRDNVAKIYPKEYQKSISELSSLIEKVELEKMDKSDKDTIELIKIMQALDIKAIQYAALHASEEVNADTLSRDGEKLVPITMTEAQRAYQDAMTRIALTPYDNALVKRAGDDAFFAANHAHNAIERVLNLQELIKESVERLVLGEENRLFDISNALGYKEARNQPMGKQVIGITRVAKEIVQAQQQSMQAIGAANNQIKILENRLKDANDALQRAKTQLTDKDVQLSGKDAQLADNATQFSEKDAQLKILNDQIAQLAEENKSLLDAQAVKPKTTKAQR